MFWQKKKQFKSNEKKGGFTPTPIAPKTSKMSAPACASTADRRSASAQLVSGFTIVEMLVSVTILALSLGAALSLIQQSASDLNTARQRMVATYLANEGIEIIRQQRDTNEIIIRNDPPGPPPPSTNWDDEFGGGSNCGSANGCIVSVVDTSGNILSDPRIEKCTGGCTNVNDPAFALRKTGDGMYGHLGSGVGASTPFYRKVKVESGGGLRSNERRIIVIVQFSKSGKTEQVVVREILSKLQ